MSRMRVINLGLPKTGTTTLARALRRAGLHVADWRIRPTQTKREGIHGRFVGRVMYRDYFGNGDPLSRLDDFDAFTEISALSGGHGYWPQTDWALIDAIQRHHPGARFLLSYRDPLKTAHSMIKWQDLGTSRLPNNNVPGLPRSFGTTPEELAHWIEGHATFCRHVFAGCDNFLEYQIESTDAKTQIGNFLGLTLPWWGHANKRIGPRTHDNDGQA